MRRPHLLGAAALLLALAGCSDKSTGTAPDPDPIPANPDRDGDGVPNGQDAFPDDPSRFSSYTTVLLDRLAGGTFGAAVGINGGNEVVGLSEDQTGVISAVKWTVTGATASAPAVLAPIAPGGYGAAYAVSESGVAVGDAQKGQEVVAVAWPAGGGGALELSRAGFAAPSAAYGIAGARIVGEATLAGNAVAVLWSGPSADPVALGTLGGPTSSAYAIDGAGLVVGESLDANGDPRGALWKLDASGVPAPPLALAPLAGHVASVALDVNGAGEIAGESESGTGEVHAVVWKLSAAGAPGAPLDLGVGSATAINDASRIAGHRAAPGQATAIDARNASLSDAILTGTFTVSQAYGLNDSNAVVGLADGQGFVAVPQ